MQNLPNHVRNVIISSYLSILQFFNCYIVYTHTHTHVYVYTISSLIYMVIFYGNVKELKISNIIWFKVKFQFFGVLWNLIKMYILIKLFYLSEGDGWIGELVIITSNYVFKVHTILVWVIIIILCLNLWCKSS